MTRPDETPAPTPLPGTPAYATHRPLTPYEAERCRHTGPELAGFTRESHRQHHYLMATNADYRLIEHTGMTRESWELYLAVKRLRNILVAPVARVANWLDARLSRG